MLWVCWSSHFQFVYRFMNANRVLGSSKRALGGEWCPALSVVGHRSGSSKGPKPVVTCNDKKDNYFPEDQHFLSIFPKTKRNSNSLCHKCPTHLNHKWPIPTSPKTKQNSNSLCHNCPTHLNHKCSIPISSLCLTSHLMCMQKFSTKWCASWWHWCWCMLPNSTHNSPPSIRTPLDAQHARSWE